MFGAAVWLELLLLDGAELLAGAEESPVARCGAGGSGAGDGVLVGSAGALLSTNAAKLSAACDGSGRAGFGGAAWKDTLAAESIVTLNTGRPLG